MNEINTNVTTTEITPDNSQSQDVIKMALSTTPFESKKWIGMAIGVGCVMFVWLGTLICMFIKTSVANEFVSLATMVITFIGTMVTTLITGQAAMEWKMATSLSEMNTSAANASSTTTTNINKNIVEDNTKPKPYGTLADGQ